MFAFLAVDLNIKDKNFLFFSLIIKIEGSRLQESQKFSYIQIYIQCKMTVMMTSRLLIFNKLFKSY